MTKNEPLRDQLEEFAIELRPSGTRRVSVLGVVQQLGARVCVRFEKDCWRPTARIELAKNPVTIFLTRRARTAGDRFLEPFEEHLLTPRERFSVAHELGHLVAFREFRVLPALERAIYWTQEECMHHFAATLLTPDALVEGWLKSVPDGEPISPFLLRRWAASEARLSEEVIAIQLCAKRSNIGFMKVAHAARKSDKHKVLRVLFAASGTQLALPRTHAHLTNEELLAKLEVEASGNGTLRQCDLNKSAQNIRYAWRHAGYQQHHSGDPDQPPGAPSSIFWICAAAETLVPATQLSLWNSP
jgi:hypothetical protein